MVALATCATIWLLVSRAIRTVRSLIRGKNQHATITRRLNRVQALRHSRMFTVISANNSVTSVTHARSWLPRSRNARQTIRAARRTIATMLQHHVTMVRHRRDSIRKAVCVSIVASQVTFRLSVANHAKAANIRRNNNQRGKPQAVCKK